MDPDFPLHSLTPPNTSFTIPQSGSSNLANTTQQNGFPFIPPNAPKDGKSIHNFIFLFS